MKCPKCGVKRGDRDENGPSIRVLDSRPIDGRNGWRRRLVCQCGHRFTTEERIVGDRYPRTTMRLDRLDTMQSEIVKARNIVRDLENIAHLAGSMLEDITRNEAVFESKADSKELQWIPTLQL